MKKLLLFLILISLTQSAGANIVKEKISDELINHKTFAERIKTPFLKNNTPIEDELLNPQSFKDSVFRLGVYKNKYKNEPIIDELINQDFITTASKTPIIKKEAPDYFFIERNINTDGVRVIKPKTKYDFTKKIIPVHIRIAEKMKSTKGLQEGDSIKFIAENEFEIEGKKFDKGTPVFGRVESISESDKMGTPQNIRIDNFYILNGNNEINLYGSITKTGANRAIWVYPLYQAGNICLYAAGFAFVPIHGGRAKFLTNETFTVFYENN